MADILCPWRTGHQTAFLQNSLELKLKSKYGNNFHFTPMGGWQKLKEACINGTVKDPLQCLAEEIVYAERLGIGDFELFFSIFMTHQRNFHSVNARKEIWRLCSQELDPDELFEYMKSIDCVGGKDKDELMDWMPEEQRIGFLLGTLIQLKGADEGFEMLRDYCVNHDYKFILNEEKELYTAKVIIGTRMKESTEAKENRNIPDSEMYIHSLHIQDPNCYFDTIAEDVDVQEIFMKLVPASDTTKDKAVQTDPYFHQENNSVGASFDGDHRVINQGQVENHSNAVTSVVTDIIRSSNDYHSFVQEEGRIIVALCTENCDQQHVQQSTELVREAREHIKKDEEVVQMVLELEKICE